MAVKSKVHKRSAASPATATRLIQGGGSSSRSGGEAAEVEAVLVRLPVLMSEKIDIVLDAAPIKTPRHRFILEAIQEKLARAGQ